ncbi:site-specific integrase [Mycobacterium sp.]|uniref:site-specific integrase n=1 Tax=Mycobacterium sp. TaxID=1785 RepID=UPI00333FB3BF|nr:putative Integrase [Mycobacterium sp.]
MSQLWTVHWVTDTAPKLSPTSTHPMLDGWAGLTEREEQMRIRSGDPFMLDPNLKADARLTRFFSRSGFVQLAKSTKVSYTNDYRVFFNFLWLRGKHWDEADLDDLLDFEDWRRRSPRNPARVSGAKWNRELAALQRLYRWATAQQVLAVNPMAVKTVRNRHGDMVETADAWAKDVRSSNVRWLTPRAYRLWRDVGLRGYTAEGRPDRSWRGRHDDRNGAYADLLFSSGLRRTEAGSLLTWELPPTGVSQQRFYPGRVAAAVTKGKRARAFYVSAQALREIEAYVGTTRRAAIRRAQAQHRYDDIDGLRTVIDRSGRTRRVLHWRDRHGHTGQGNMDSLDPDERRLLFIDGPAGPEPLWLWLAEDGTPFDAHSWEAVFRAGSERSRVVLADAMTDPPFCTPHTCRHSFALHMLVALHHAMDQRFGLTAEERRDYRLLYGDPWRMVKDLLGHASEQTTRDIYLAPVADLQVRSLLLEEDRPGVTELLTRIAAASERVIDGDGAA